MPSTRGRNEQRSLSSDRATKDHEELWPRRSRRSRSKKAKAFVFFVAEFFSALLASRALAAPYCSVLPDVMCRRARPCVRSKTVGSVLADHRGMNRGTSAPVCLLTLQTRAHTFSAPFPRSAIRRCCPPRLTGATRFRRVRHMATLQWSRSMSLSSRYVVAGIAVCAAMYQSTICSPVQKRTP